MYHDHEMHTLDSDEDEEGMLLSDMITQAKMRGTFEKSTEISREAPDIPSNRETILKRECEERLRRQTEPDDQEREMIKQKVKAEKCAGLKRTRFNMIPISRDQQKQPITSLTVESEKKNYEERERRHECTDAGEKTELVEELMKSLSLLSNARKSSALLSDHFSEKSQLRSRCGNDRDLSVAELKAVYAK